MEKPRKPITADGQMTRPIDSLVWAAACLVRRAEKWAQMDMDTLTSPAVHKIMAVDEEMRQAYLVALRLRAREVCQFARECGIRNMTIAQVQAEPFLMALAVDHKRGGR